MEFITLYDFLLLPLYVGLIYIIAFKIRDRHYPVGHPWRNYFIPGLSVKLIGGVFIGLIYQYYYGAGDTGNYFRHAKLINSAFLESPVKWFNLVFHLADWFDPDYAEYISKMIWYESSANYIVSTFCALIGLFCFTTFLPCTVIMAALAYTGVWAMFRTFARQYPSITHYIAIALLFIPSVAMWGSGIFKDTLCLFGLGWMTHIVFRTFVERRISLSHLLLLVLSFIIIYIAKIYLLMAYIPSMAVWILLNYSGRIRIYAFRVVLQVSVIVICGLGLIVANSVFAAELQRYSLENFAVTSGVTRDYIKLTTGDEGSGYDLGLEESQFGLVKIIPQAINVTFFRPYIWEAKKPIVMLNALEATIIMILTIKVLYQVGLKRAYKAIASDANIQFCLIFSLIFGYAVGISSYNFGSLSRYRIPCMPTYVLAMMLIYYKYYSPQIPVLGFLRKRKG